MPIKILSIMHVLTIIGNRPQFVKAAAVSRLLRERHRRTLVHTGQHYDDEIVGGVLPRARAAGAGPLARCRLRDQAEQLSAIMSALEPVAAEVKPDLALVYGDTNSTLAGASSAAKIGLPLAHVEAGMRSFDSAMPEERNRILADHLSELLLCSTEVAVRNLVRRGRRRGRPAGRRRDG